MSSNCRMGNTIFGKLLPPQKKRTPNRGPAGYKTEAQSSGFLNMNKSTLTAFILKFDNSRLHGKQRIVAANPHILPRFNLCSPLAHDNGAATHQLPGEALHSESFGLAISSVSGASDSLFMCHAYLTSLLH